MILSTLVLEVRNGVVGVALAAAVVDAIVGSVVVVDNVVFVVVVIVVGVGVAVAVGDGDGDDGNDKNNGDNGKAD